MKLDKFSIFNKNAIFGGFEKVFLKSKMKNHRQAPDFKKTVEKGEKSGMLNFLQGNRFLFHYSSVEFTSRDNTSLQVYFRGVVLHFSLRLRHTLNHA